MKIEWIGHACFSVTSDDGVKIITDPYKTGMGEHFKYDPIDEPADVVTVSHEHGDHNEVSSISGEPIVIRGPGKVNVKGIEFKGIAGFHDGANGAERGPNTIFTFLIDGIRLTHLGDLGHLLSSEQLGELKGTEILIAPTGAGPTLELQEVVKLWEQIKPKVVIPMHFSTVKCSFPKYGADDLMKLVTKAQKVGNSVIEFNKNDLPDLTEIMILDPSH